MVSYPPMLSSQLYVKFASTLSWNRNFSKHFANDVNQWTLKKKESFVIEVSKQWQKNE